VVGESFSLVGEVLGWLYCLLLGGMTSSRHLLLSSSSSVRGLKTDLHLVNVKKANYHQTQDEWFDDSQNIICGLLAVYASCSDGARI
jgi:hypothetical protein